MGGNSSLCLPHEEYDEEIIKFFKRIGVKGKLFVYEDDLVVKDEGELSGGSGSESSSYDTKEMKLH